VRRGPPPPWNGWGRMTSPRTPRHRVVRAQVGQGALALEVRDDDDASIQLLSPLNQPDAMTALVAERAFLSELGAGVLGTCGAYARVSGNEVALSGVMLSVDGARSVRAVFHGDERASWGARWRVTFVTSAAR